MTKPRAELGQVRAEPGAAGPLGKDGCASHLRPLSPSAPTAEQRRVPQAGPACRAGGRQGGERKIIGIKKRDRPPRLKREETRSVGRRRGVLINKTGEKVIQTEARKGWRGWGPGFPGSLQLAGTRLGLGLGLGGRLGHAAEIQRGADGSGGQTSPRVARRFIIPLQSSGDAEPQPCPPALLALPAASWPSARWAIAATSCWHGQGSAGGCASGSTSRAFTPGGVIQLFSVSFDRWKGFLVFPPPSVSQRLQHFSTRLKGCILTVPRDSKKV